MRVICKFILTERSRHTGLKLTAIFLLRTGGLTIDVERISIEQLLALHMMANSLKEKSEFYADVYAAMSELIERREAAGELK